MKKYFIFITLILLGTVVRAQHVGDIPNGISLALKNGNSRELVKYFNDNVEMVIIDDEGIYSKKQAEMILKDFFNRKKIKSFSLLHQGGRSDAKYGIGTLQAENGSYRVYFLLKNKGGNSLIHQFRIEKENE